jgi:hypothetical protein
MLLDAAPDLAPALATLSAEHRVLDGALDALARAQVDDRPPRVPLVEPAASVRDRVHAHLHGEEALVVPALRDSVPDAVWLEFSQHAMATAPPVGAHLQIGFFDLAGSRADVESTLDALPSPARAAVPELRRLAHAAFESLALPALTDTKAEP